MKKMLYISFVDWDWIKQRPHFLAEGLSEFYEITVLYMRSRNRKGLQKNSREGLSLHPLFPIPGAGRIRAVGCVNRLWMKWAISRYLKKTKAEMLYLTYPNQVPWIPKWYTGKVIYDCMDYHVGFQPDPHLRAKLSEMERQLCARADLVLTSSNYLNSVLSGTYECRKILTVRNGYNGQIADTQGVDCKASGVCVFCYFGTISSWFHFEYLLKSLEDFPDIEYWLIGPIEKGVQIPANERIKYLGVIEHKNLFQATLGAHCFIMPFRLLESILAVDPVKLYEYVNFDRHVLSVGYEEIKRFEKYAWFYQDYEGFKSHIANIADGAEKKYSARDRMDLLMDNSWSCRVRQIVDGISEIYNTDTGAKK